MSSHSIAVSGALARWGLAGPPYQFGAGNGHRPVIFEADDRVGWHDRQFSISMGLAIETLLPFSTAPRTMPFLQMLDETGHCRSHALDRKRRWAISIGTDFSLGANPIALLKFFWALSLIAKFRYGLHALFSAHGRNDWAGRSTHWKPPAGSDAGVGP
jgi:hypothetical protein